MLHINAHTCRMIRLCDRIYENERKEKCGENPTQNKQRQRQRQSGYGGAESAQSSEIVGSYVYVHITIYEYVHIDGACATVVYALSIYFISCW